jgi:CheY-like chemotaxis protein
VATSSVILLRSRKIREIQDVPGHDICDDSLTATTAVIVDDHPTFRRFARELLESAGLVVLGEAGDGAAALAAVRELRPDVVLLDVLLPDTSGFEVARALAAGPERPLVLLTSSRSAADLGGPGVWDGAAGFIAKSELTVDALGALLGEAA